MSELHLTHLWKGIFFKEVHEMVRSRFGEVCSCCCLPALPGPAWVLLNYVSRRIKETSVDIRLGNTRKTNGLWLGKRLSPTPLSSQWPKEAISRNLGSGHLCGPNKIKQQA